MIIVSQDRKKIYNFDRINFIEVCQTMEGHGVINMNFADYNEKILGEYETIERAMEVLQEIEEQYQKICDDSYFIVYEMPETPIILETPTVYYEEED